MALGGPFRAAERAMLCRAPKAPAQAGRVSVTSLSPLLSRARLRLLPGCVAAPPSRRRRLSPSARAQSAVRGPSGTARSQADPRPGFARRRRAGLHWAEHGPPGPSSDRDSERLQCASPGLSDSERLQCASPGLTHALSCAPPPPRRRRRRSEALPACRSSALQSRRHVTWAGVPRRPRILGQCDRSAPTGWSRPVRTSRRRPSKYWSNTQIRVTSPRPSAKGGAKPSQRHPCFISPNVRLTKAAQSHVNECTRGVAANVWPRCPDAQPALHGAASWRRAVGAGAVRRSAGCLMAGRVSSADAQARGPL